MSGLKYLGAPSFDLYEQVVFVINYIFICDLHSYIVTNLNVGPNRAVHGNHCSWCPFLVFQLSNVSRRMRLNLNADSAAPHLFQCTNYQTKRFIQLNALCIIRIISLTLFKIESYQCLSSKMHCLDRSFRFGYQKNFIPREVSIMICNKVGSTCIQLVL